MGFSGCSYSEKTRPEVILLKKTWFISEAVAMDEDQTEEEVGS